LTDIEDKIEGHETKEEIPLQEANVSESSVLERKIEGGVTVEMVVKEVFIATALPESESLQASNLVAQELQAIAEVANVDDVINAGLTEDVILGIGDTSTEGMVHYGEAGASSVV